MISRQCRHRRVGSQNQKYADVRETNGKRAGSNLGAATCIFGTRRALRSTNTHVNYAMRASMHHAHVKPLHTRTLYATENAAQDILRKHVAMYK